MRAIAIGVLTAILIAGSAAAAGFESELIFPLENIHNHASAIVELPNGDLLAVWYHGSGERRADDVVVEYSRLRKGRAKWEPRQTLADTPGFPDCNPTVFVDSRRRLWLLWPVVIANEWHTALMKYSISTDYLNPARPPRWDVSSNLLFKPPNFAERVNAWADPLLRAVQPGSREETFLQRAKKNAADRYFSRMGWMTRAHPIELPSGRILVPLYSDGYSFSIVAYTDDGGLSWAAREPIVGMGSIQPSIVRKKDGTLVAYMRDNGPPPKRLHVAESKDQGQTWSPARDTELPNPGSGAEAIVLRDGLWALIYNDTEVNRNRLAVSLSDDEGRSWKWTRHLEDAPSGSFHYPSLIQARDGSLHASYSYFAGEGKSIKHVRFPVEWVKGGGGARRQ